jgi:hypothetical protein
MDVHPFEKAMNKQLMTICPKEKMLHTGEVVYFFPSRKPTDVILSEMVDGVRREEKFQQKKTRSRSGRKRRRGPKTQVTIYCNNMED